MQRYQMICIACRRRLFAAALFRAPAPTLRPWQAKASFSSDSAGMSGSSHENDDLVPSIEALELEGLQGPDKDGKHDEDVPSKPRFSPLRRRKAMRQSGEYSRESTLEIFEKVVRQQVDQEKSADGSNLLSPEVLMFYNDLARLRPMMKEASIETCLDFFLTKVWSNIPFEKKPLLLKQRGTYLMMRVAEAKANDFDNEKLPSVARITELFNELESLSTYKWSGLAMKLIQNIVTRSTAPDNYPSSEAYEASLSRKEALLQDLVESWVVFHRNRLRPIHRSQSTQEPEFRFPPINEDRLRRFAEYGNLIGAMSLMFPHFAHEWRHVPIVAIASFMVLVDSAYTNPEIQHKAKPLLQPIGHILNTVHVQKTWLQKTFESYPGVRSYVLTHWDSVISRLGQATKSRFSGPGKGDIVIMKRNIGQFARVNNTVIQKQITAALGMGDAEAVETAWTHFWGREVNPTNDRILKLKEMPEMFDYFVMAFTALHRPQRAVDVWDRMVFIDIKPTPKTWTSLIEGCRRAKDAVGIENVWKKMVIAGVDLDVAAWSARIVGLMDCGEPEAGLRALDEMLRMPRMPKNTSNSGSNTRIPPTEPINAAIAGLIRLNAMSAAQKILAWASDKDIKPDIVTYNTLLRPIVQQGNGEQIDGLLKMMKVQGVQPDAATFTLLLDGLMGGIKNADPIEQEKTVSELFKEMEAAGVSADMATFARMLHLLLVEGAKHTEAAVTAIRAYIKEKSLRPTPYIYTILVNHYFSERPPKIAAVDELLDELRHDGKTRLDRVFWERVIKGYASAGMVDKAFETFERIKNIGTALTMHTLETLLHALVNAGKMDKAKMMVDLVMSHRKMSRFGRNYALSVDMNGERSQARYWKHGFWAFAQDCGLLSLAERRQLVFGEEASS